VISRPAVSVARAVAAAATGCHPGRPDIHEGLDVFWTTGTADGDLHFELWLGDHYLGQFLRPIELREWLAGLLR
jgi:hypothetical protein